MSIPLQDWLIKRENLLAIQHCKKAIHREFGEKIALTDPQLLPKLFHYAEQSRNPWLQQQSKALTDNLSLHAPKLLQEIRHCLAGAPERRYRGQVIENQTNSTSSNTKPAATQATTKERIYRGQRIA